MIPRRLLKLLESPGNQDQGAQGHQVIRSKRNQRGDSSINMTVKHITMTKEAEEMDMLLGPTLPLMVFRSLVLSELVHMHTDMDRATSLHTSSCDAIHASLSS